MTHNPKTRKKSQIEQERYQYSRATYCIMGKLATGISKLKLNSGRTFKVKVEIPTKVYEQLYCDRIWDEPRPSKTCPENMMQLVLVMERACSPYLRVYQNAEQMKSIKKEQSI